MAGRRARPVGAVERATLAALRGASGALTNADKGAVAALKVLARKIDTEDELRELALDYAAEHKQKPPSVDNVSLPTYLKFCESLGLTPAGRGRLPEKKSGGAGGTLSLLRGEAAATRGSAG